MKPVSVSRRLFLQSSTVAVTWLAASPAIIGRAQAATIKMKCSSSLPNDPKYANGRVYYDNLVKNLKANGLGEQIEVAFFPDNQLGQEIDVINSVKLGVIDLMVSGSSISANLVPLVGTFHRLLGKHAARTEIIGPGDDADTCALEQSVLDRLGSAGVEGFGLLREAGEQIAEVKGPNQRHEIGRDR